MVAVVCRSAAGTVSLQLQTAGVQLPGGVFTHYTLHITHYTTCAGQSIILLIGTLQAADGHHELQHYWPGTLSFKFYSKYITCIYIFDEEMTRYRCCYKSQELSQCRWW